MNASTVYDIESLEPIIARPRARWAEALLLVNGIALGTTGLLQSQFDLAGYFLDIGPLAAALHGNPDALAYVEAHGFAVIVGLLLVLNRRGAGATWHWVAAATHLLLGAANLMFWPTFVTYGLVPMGTVATAAHMLFFVLELVAALMRSPGLLTGPGASFRILTLITLATGAVLHGASLPMGREAFVANLFTPAFDAVFAVPMTLSGILGWVLYRRGLFPALWQRLVYIAMLLYFTLSIFIHARTLVTWDTSYVEAFPSWYSLPIFVLFGLLAAFTVQQRFAPAGRLK